MADATETTGKVLFVKVGNGIGITEILDNATQMSELFFIWFDAAQPDVPSAFDRIKQSQQVSLLREALVHNLNVLVIHDAGTGSFIRSVELKAPGT
jgi:hypothetical protein